MAPFVDWLRRLLTHGEAVLDGPPQFTDAAGPVLATAFADHVLDVAGPPIPFDANAALAAARLLADACWRLVAPDDGPVRLPPLGEPRTPAAHLSADVTLRFLPAVYRRAAVRSPDDLLAAALAEVLRRWPLSGVLADLKAPPAGDLTFGGHPGLQLLYAERLLGRELPAWVPTAGLARERAELVFAGRPLPTGRLRNPARHDEESPGD
jgi:hypothetical protein